MRGALAVLGFAVLAVPASAAPVTFSSIDVDSFTHFAPGDSGPAPLAALFTGDGQYTTVWSAGTLLAPVAVVVDLRWTGGPIGTAVVDDFQFVLTNQNETTWTYRVSINGGAATAAFSLAPTLSQLVSFSSISAPITQVDVFITDAIPHARGDGSADRVAELQIAPIPEPGTLLLLGSGISALVLRRRRKA